MIYKPLYPFPCWDMALTAQNDADTKAKYSDVDFSPRTALEGFAT